MINTKAVSLYSPSFVSQKLSLAHRGTKILLSFSDGKANLNVL